MNVKSTKYNLLILFLVYKDNILAGTNTGLIRLDTFIQRQGDLRSLLHTNTHKYKCMKETRLEELRGSVTKETLKMQRFEIHESYVLMI